MGKTMNGYDFFKETEAGKALLKVLPPKLTRVIIDIKIDEAVKIYCSSYETGEAFNLNWDNIIERLEIVNNEPDHYFIAAEDIKTGDPVFISELDKKLHKLNMKI
jgi:hypothetical protein